MSRLYSKHRGYHGLSRDDDEDSGGLFGDRHTHHSGRRDGSSPGRNRGQNSKVTAIKPQAAIGTRTAHRPVCPWKILTKTMWIWMMKITRERAAMVIGEGLREKSGGLN